LFHQILVHDCVEDCIPANPQFLKERAERVFRQPGQGGPAGELRQRNLWWDFPLIPLSLDGRTRIGNLEIAEICKAAADA
jgi:hypothetical protein